MCSRFPLVRRLWHKKGVRVHPKAKARPALDELTLDELALHYVGRFATTRAKLRYYLARKVRERGWAGDREPDLHGLADRLARLGYVDDATYAAAKARALTARGFGKRRIEDKLRQAGIDDADANGAREFAEKEAMAAALRFAERKRIGPFSARICDRSEREKAIAAMVRAGHPLTLARVIAELPPGTIPDFDIEG
jgi:regulatory protein